MVRKRAVTTSLVGGIVPLRCGLCGQMGGRGVEGEGLNMSTHSDSCGCAALCTWWAFVGTRAATPPLTPTSPAPTPCWLLCAEPVALAAPDAGGPGRRLLQTQCTDCCESLDGCGGIIQVKLNILDLTTLDVCSGIPTVSSGVPCSCYVDTPYAYCSLISIGLGGVQICVGYTTGTYKAPFAGTCGTGSANDPIISGLDGKQVWRLRGLGWGPEPGPGHTAINEMCMMQALQKWPRASPV